MRHNVSIHLMLLFIWQPSVHNSCPNRVSIHLMLLFIILSVFMWCLCPGFNTSHVTLYPLVRDLISFTLNVSIHLMLLFIKIKISHVIVLCGFNTSHVTLYRQCCSVWVFSERSFQYISCYSLSMYSKCQKCGRKRFNTSHVTLYLGSNSITVRTINVSIHLMLLFIHLP